MKGIIALLTFFALLAPMLYGQRLDPVTRWTTIAGSEFRVHTNIVYSKANNIDLKLDVIMLDNSNKPRPTLIEFHGGGWVRESKHEIEFRVLPYLSHGMNGVNVDYRLASMSSAPAAVEDCRCALRWVYDHAKEYGFDTSRLVVEGHSAGGHLALMTGMLTRNAGFDNECPEPLSQAKQESIKVAAIINYFGVTDVAELLQGPNTRWFALEWLGSPPNRMELARRVSPLTYFRKGLPPIITLQGDKDPVVPYSQGVRLHKALDAAGDPNELITIHGGGHDHWSREENLRAKAAVFSFLEAHGILPR